MIDLNEIIEGLEYVNGCPDENVYYNIETKEVFFPDDLEYGEDDEKYREIAINWCKKNNIKFKG